MFRRSLRSCVVCIVALLPACGGGSEGGGETTVSAPVTVTLSTEAVSLDRWEDSTTLTVTRVVDAGGTAVTNCSVSWASDDESIVTVDNGGLVTSNQAGVATVTATVSNSAGSTEATTEVTVHVQQNMTCTIPAAPERGAVAAAKTYTGLASDTVSQLADSFHRDITPGLNGDGIDDMLWLETTWVSATKEMPNAATAWLSDGDGYNDILKPNESGEPWPAFELLRNNGDMTFTDVTESRFVHTAMLDGAYRPFLHDLNADGWPDVFAQGAGDYLRIFWNNGNGFTEYRFPADTAIDTRGASTAVGDFDGDGDLDIHVGRGSYENFVLMAD